jgi:hypothetical protein
VSPRRLALILTGLLAVTAAEPPAFADRTVGLMVDAGLPDGAQGAILYHPTGAVRLHAGGGYNLISPSVRGGVSLLPLSWIALVVEGGRYFDGDANPLMQRLRGDDDYHHDGLSRVGYDWASAHLGLELGGDHVRFTVHAGYSYVRTDLRDADALVGAGDQLRFERAPQIRGLVPSARIGLILYLF